MMKAEDPDFDVEKANKMTKGSGSVGRNSSVQGIGDMKAMMRASMNNIKTYGDTSSASDRNDRTSKFSGKNLSDLEGTYNAVKFGQ